MNTHRTTKEAIEEAATIINRENEYSIRDYDEPISVERISEIITEEFQRCQYKDL